jgi:citronellol/citronellal dehydrogenase
MTSVDATRMLRPALLDGLSVLLAGPPGPLGDAVARAFADLGARVCTCLPDGEDEPACDQAVLAAVEASETIGPIGMLVVDGAALFARGGAGEVGEGHAALRACLDATWNITRAVVNHAFLPTAPGGAHEPAIASPTAQAPVAANRRIVYLAPAPDAGPRAGAARAGLENLARTLSVEWARHRINVVTIAPGASTSAAETAALTAYLASPAGDYFSGCLLDLGGAPRALSEH